MTEQRQIDEPTEAADATRKEAGQPADLLTTLEDEDELLPLMPEPRQRSMACRLASKSFEATAGRALMLRLATRGDGVCVCVTVPDTSWEGPLREMAAEMGRPVRVMFRDAAARRTKEQDLVDSSIKWLQAGAALLCISQDIAAAIPPEFRSVADAVLNLGMPTSDMIADVIAVVTTRRRLRHVPGDLGQGLNLNEVAACLRTDEASRRTVTRLQRAQRTKRSSAVEADGPRLEDLAGYGPAAEWGMRLRDGLAAFLAGKVDWRRLDPQAILHGPPGTGKSMFAPALARSLGVRCIRTSVGHWFASNGGDLGQTIKTIAAMFEEARLEVGARGAVVLFIDEIDGLPNRGALDGNHGSWWRPVVNYFLATLDGAGPHLSGIVLVAATNDLGAVDPALLRPGRFGTHLHVGAPRIDDLVSILGHHLGGESCPISRQDLAEIVRPLVGTTPAMAAAWARKALRRAEGEGRGVRPDDVMHVVHPPDTRPARERRRVATHEAGHAVACALLDGRRLVSSSILQTAISGGETTFRSRDEALLSRDEIEDGVVILLAGRAADTVVGDGATSAAGGIGPMAGASDLAQATARLTAVHASYGLGRTLRHRGDPLRSDTLRGDEELTRDVEADLRRSMIRAERLMTEHAHVVRAVAEALLARSFLDGEEVRRIIAADGVDKQVSH